MANQLDSFSAQIVSYVRTGMSDEAVLELVKNKLGLAYGGIVGAAASGRSAGRSARAGRKAAAPAAPVPSAGPSGGGKKATRKARGKKKSKARAKAKAAPPVARAASAPPRVAKAKPGRRKKAGRRGGGNRDQEMEAVERVIKASKGMSASEISTKTKIPQSRVSAHVRALKSDKRIFQGGDRRFARYAADQKSAEHASEEARKNASGPRRS
jgi:DNA-binding transcriptional ArsR family regulator